MSRYAVAFKKSDTVTVIAYVETQREGEILELAWEQLGMTLRTIVDPDPIYCRMV